MREIPGEAIIAAEAAVFDAMIEHGPDGHTDGHDKITRAALGVAAPILMAKAWDEAAASIIDEHGNPIVPTNIDNPYRSQP